MMTMTRMKTIDRKNKDMTKNVNKVNKSCQFKKEKHDGYGALTS